MSEDHVNYKDYMSPKEEDHKDHMSSQEEDNKDHVSSQEDNKDHMSSQEGHKDRMSSQGGDHVIMGGKFAGVGDFSAITMTTALSHDHSNLIKDDTTCIR